MSKETTSVSIDSKWKEIISAHDEVNFSGAANELAKKIAQSLAEGDGVETNPTNDVLVEMARSNREEALKDLEEALEQFNHWDSVLQDALADQEEARENREECAKEVASFFPEIRSQYQTIDNGRLDKEAEKCDLSPGQLLKKAHVDYGMPLPHHLDLDDVELPEVEDDVTDVGLSQGDDLVQQARRVVNAD